MLLLVARPRAKHVSQNGSTWPIEYSGSRAASGRFRNPVIRKDSHYSWGATLHIAVYSQCSSAAKRSISSWQMLAVNFYHFFLMSMTMTDCSGQFVLATEVTVRSHDPHHVSWHSSSICSNWSQDPRESSNIILKATFEVFFKIRATALIRIFAGKMYYPLVN